MSTTTITLPTGFVPQVLVVATDTLGQLAPYLTLIVGVLLATIVIGIMIDHFKK